MLSSGIQSGVCVDGDVVGREKSCQELKRRGAHVSLIWRQSTANGHTLEKGRLKKPGKGKGKLNI